LLLHGLVELITLCIADEDEFLFDFYVVCHLRSVQVEESHRTLIEGKIICTRESTIIWHNKICYVRGKDILHDFNLLFC